MQTIKETLADFFSDTLGRALVFGLAFGTVPIVLLSYAVASIR